MLDKIYNEAKLAMEELCSRSGVGKGAIVVIGCSTSEIVGEKIGTSSSPDAAAAVFKGLYEVAKSLGVYLAVQCCEHLNRAIVTERDAVPFADEVNVVPQPKAGGSLATVAYKSFNNPVVLEGIRADAGMDIGFTLIGMHLKAVAVPLRLVNSRIGNATVLAARTRPKFIGGIRAVYDEEKL